MTLQASSHHRYVPWRPQCMGSECALRTGYGRRGRREPGRNLHRTEVQEGQASVLPMQPPSPKPQHQVRGVGDGGTLVRPTR